MKKGGKKENEKRGEKGHIKKGGKKEEQNYNPFLIILPVSELLLNYTITH